MNIDETPETNEEPDFAAFEAQANAGEQPEPEAKADADKGDEEPLELTDKVEDGDKPDEAKDGEDEEKKPRNHNRWQSRVDALTARLREAEQRAIAAEKAAGLDAAPVDERDQPPNPDDYEFGEADPKYLKADSRYEARQVVSEERQKAAKEARTEALTAKLEAGMASVEATGAEKYDDFEAKVTEAVAARGGEPLPALLSVGIAVSPAGSDIVYRMATDPGVADELERLAGIDPEAAAEAFGELEGEYLDTDKDLNLADPLDRARWRGRKFARKTGAKVPETKPAVKATEAPEPPGHRVRGGSGQFETSPDTTDFAKFEKLAKKAAAG